MPERFLESSGQKAPDERLRRLVETGLGKQTATWAAPETGLSRAARYLVEFTDGSEAFVKAAADDDTEMWLRNEHLALMRAPAWYVPHVFAWVDEAGGRPVLVTERLTGHWPASHKGVDWRPGDLALVFEALQELSETKAPRELPALQERPTSRWRQFANEPEPMLDLGLFSEQWFKDSLEALAFAESSLLRSGDRFVHGDVRSDNICIVEKRVVFVDWSSAAAGAAKTDLASFLPTAHLEGGPRPFDIMPDGGSWAAAGAAAQIERLLEGDLPAWLQRVVTRLAGIHLEWAAECLGLAAPVSQAVGGYWV